MRSSKPQGAYSLVEVMVALAIFTIGVIAILNFFPPSLSAAAEASLKSKAALLAQQKVEEARRDANQMSDTIEEIENLSAPTDPVVFSEDERLVYQYHSRSLLSPNNDDPNLSFDDFGVARVIVSYNPEFRPDGGVLVELRFDR